MGLRARSTRLMTSRFWRAVCAIPSSESLSKLLMRFSSTHCRTKLGRFSCSEVPRVITTPTEIPPSAWSRLKFSRSRSKKGSLLFHSISRAIRYRFPIGALAHSNVIDLVRNRFTRFVIDGLLDCEGFFDPPSRRQAVPKTLRAFRFAAARPDDFLDRNRLVKYHLFEFSSRIRKIDF